MNGTNDAPTFFDQLNDEGKEISVDYIDVVRVSFVSAEKLTLQDLFGGYEELYAITYSNSIDFTSKLLKYFEYAEIIFGCYGVINQDTALLVASQQETIELFCKSKNIKWLYERIETGSLRLYVPKETDSHEKLYLLKASDGRTRVITGSANMSYNAFLGKQREVIHYSDDSASFDYYYGLYLKYQEQCTQHIQTELIKAVILDPKYLENNINKVPIFQLATSKGAVSFQNPEMQPDYSDAVEEKANALRPILPKGINKGKGKTTITIEDVAKIQRENKALIEKKKSQTTYPKLHLDYDHRTVSFNGTPMELDPPAEYICRDIDCIINFLDGYKDFIGDVKEAQSNYYAYLNWFFASPFMSYLRSIGIPHNYSVTFFPVFGIISGQSNAGKTKFVDFLTKLMTGDVIANSGSDSFTGNKMDKLRRNCEGVPIIIDELGKQQYDNNYERIIKTDDSGLKEHLLNQPAISITANNITSLKQEVTKRCVYFRQNITASKQTGARNSKVVGECISKAGTALWCEYARRMFPIIDEFMEHMQNDELEYFPDILKASSEILLDIFSQYKGNYPSYIRALDFESYFGDRIIGKTAIKRIEKAWKTQPECFTANEKDNTLTYSVPDQASHELTALVNELPPVLHPQKMGSMLIMDLDEARKFFELRFKKGIWNRR